MVTCPKGHESESTDYCDECGTLISGTAATPPPASEAAVTALAPAECPACKAQLSGRFCEECGHDSLATPGETPEPPPVQMPARMTSVNRWEVIVSADREYFERMRQMEGPEALEIEFPRFCPERRFPLTEREWLIGRRSKTRGIYPEIDLVGPPEDAAVSHTHALLTPQPDGGWTLTDLRSTNRTYLDGDPEPIKAEEPVPLGDGTVINLGAWTRLTFRAATQP